MLRKCQLVQVDNKFKIEIGVLDFTVNIANDVDLQNQVVSSSFIIVK